MSMTENLEDGPDINGIGELPEWAEEHFISVQPTLAFTHAPMHLIPLRYVGVVGSAQGLLVIGSGNTERDGKRWLHLSMSRRSRLPTYDDLCLVKDTFIGRDRLAVQVFARTADHVNHAKFCLHLWSCLDGDPVPDFRHLGMI